MYDATDSIELFNESALKTIRKSNDNGWNDTTLGDELFKDANKVKNTGRNFTLFLLQTSAPRVNWTETSSIMETKTETFPSIGDLGIYNAKDIYSNTSDLSKTFSKTWSITNITLEKGMPIFAGKKDEKIKWTAVFSDVGCQNWDSTNSKWQDAKNENEVEIYLSKTPFSDKVSTGSVESDNNNLIKQKGSAVNYWLTDNRKCEIDITMDTDSIVYMKVKPHKKDDVNLNVDGWWEITLDMNGSNGQWKLEAEA